MILSLFKEFVCTSMLLVIAHPAGADTFGSGANTFDIEFVSIGNPGNLADADDGSSLQPGIQNFGSVAQTYRIGKFEISEQMIDKANTLGGLSISMNTRGADKPATSVTWNEAARFINWLNISSGSRPAYKFALQPGDAGYVVNANILLWDPADAGYNPSNLYRNSLAKYFLPSIDEWYKAAYYDPTSGVYYDYPTGSNSVPTAVASGTAAGTAVYLQSLVTGPADVTLAGGLSPYGTMGQGGNVWELEETAYNSPNFSVTAQRGLRGGIWSHDSNTLHVSRRDYAPAPSAFAFIGFRVASIAVPEPSTLLLSATIGLGLLWRRKGLCCASILVVAVVFSNADRAHADTFGSGANTFDIEFVDIGDPGNSADTTGSPNPAGAVSYEYRMGKFEISEQMIDKANLLGGLGITKDTRGLDKPATSTSWNEAARFVNWLNITSGSTPAYKFAIQPGEVAYSANVNIELWTPSDPGYNPNNLYRSSLAKYFLPSVDEWYKAAYFDPTGGVYYDYPTGRDSLPNGIDFVGDLDFDVVFNSSGAVGTTNPQPNDITNVGVLSPYGTAGQGGNVYEWQETDFDLDMVNGPSGTSRYLRGGSWNNVSVWLRASNRQGPNPLFEAGLWGFRVASIAVPEPSTLLLSAMIGLGLLWRRREGRPA